MLSTYEKLPFTNFFSRFLPIKMASPQPVKCSISNVWYYLTQPNIYLYIYCIFLSIYLSIYISIDQLPSICQPLPICQPLSICSLLTICQPLTVSSVSIWQPLHYLSDSLNLSVGILLFVHLYTVYTSSI